MADNYIEKRMDAVYGGRTVVKRINPSLDTLLRRNRSCRGYVTSHIVTYDVLKKIVAANTLVASGMNRQALRFRLVTKDMTLPSSDKNASRFILDHVKMGAALPELHLPLEGTEPEAFIIVCSKVPEDRIIDIDLGISLQSMSLKASEIGLSALVICAFDKNAVKEAFGLQLEPLAILAVGKGAEKIELKTIHEGDSQKYYRENGVHYVPKLSVDDIIL